MAAISDVGYWRWWAADLPAVFQVEFGGVQLWNPPPQPGDPPSGVVALRFGNPSVVAFLTGRDATAIPAEWWLALHEDRIEPFSVAHDEFTLTSEEQLKQIAHECAVEYLAGNEGALFSGASTVKLAFRAGDVGLVVRAEEMTVLSSSGALTSAQVEASSAAWWKYWREYWDRRDTDAPMPKDYACEVTIPIKDA